jgi:hypothetical protein
MHRPHNTNSLVGFLVGVDGAGNYSGFDSSDDSDEEEEEEDTKKGSKKSKKKSVKGTNTKFTCFEQQQQQRSLSRALTLCSRLPGKLDSDLEAMLKELGLLEVAPVFIKAGITWTVLLQFKKAPLSLSLY